MIGAFGCSLRIAIRPAKFRNLFPDDGLVFHPEPRRKIMPRGDKSAYTDKQKRKAEHIEESYEGRGVSHEEAERRAWAAVSRESGGGKKAGSRRGHPENHESAERGGRDGGHAAASRAGGPPAAATKEAGRTEAMPPPCTSSVPRRRLPLIFRHADARL